MKDHIVKLDTKNRVTLTKVTKKLSNLYRAYSKGDTIILEPIREISKEEEWLFDPKNKHILERVKKSIQSGGKHDLGSFAKYVEEDAE